MSSCQRHLSTQRARVKARAHRTRTYIIIIYNDVCRAPREWTFSLRTTELEYSVFYPLAVNVVVSDCEKRLCTYYIHYMNAMFTNIARALLLRCIFVRFIFFSTHSTVANNNIVVFPFSQVSCNGVFELRIKSFSNELGREASGSCCGGVCGTPCRTKFRACLKHYETNINVNSTCTFGDVVTPVLGENSLTLPANATPIAFHFNFTWPVSRCRIPNIQDRIQ